MIVGQFDTTRKKEFNILKIEIIDRFNVDLSKKPTSTNRVQPTTHTQIDIV